MRTEFTKLNTEWDAEPSDPRPTIRIVSSDLSLTFFLNAYVDPAFREYDRGALTFTNCWRYRLGPTNDEGWYKGHCRFKCWAPDWGDFYEVAGDIREHGPKDWVLVGPAPQAPTRHFLFYFKDNTFECDASDWDFLVLRVSDAEYASFRSAETKVSLGHSTIALRGRLDVDGENDN